MENCMTLMFIYDFGYVVATRHKLEQISMNNASVASP